MDRDPFITPPNKKNGRDRIRSADYRSEQIKGGRDLQQFGKGRFQVVGLLRVQLGQTTPSQQGKQRFRLGADPTPFVYKYIILILKVSRPNYFIPYDLIADTERRYEIHPCSDEVAKKVSKDRTKEKPYHWVDRQHVVQGFLDLCEESIFPESSIMAIYNARKTRGRTGGGWQRK